jgi:predicted alpha/beta-hydrolase family hydrolase
LKRPSELTIDVGTGAETTALVYPAEQPRIGAALILGHGAGAGQHSSFMTDFAAALAGLGADIITFNFLYTEQKRKLPDRAPALEMCYRAVIETIRDHVDSARHALFIGGKSMGGRIATQVAAADADVALAGLVLLGYPLHPPGRPDKLRDAHLPAVGRPVLFVQGSRDGFGTPDELQPIFARMIPTPTMYEVIGGDHSFRLTGRDPMRQRAVYEDIQREIVRWMALIAPGRASAR